MSADLVLVEPPDIARTELAPRAALVLPRLIVDAGPATVEKFLEFFAARIANRRTRAAYERRQRDLTPVGADPRPRDSHLAPAQHDFAGHRARAGRATRGLMRIPRTAQRRAILLQHRVEHAEARADHQLEAFGFRVDQDFNER